MQNPWGGPTASRDPLPEKESHARHIHVQHTGKIGQKVLSESGDGIEKRDTNPIPTESCVELPAKQCHLTQLLARSRR
jgi:hypothetical protein